MLSVVRGWGSFEWWWQYVYDVIDSQVNHADNGDSGAGDVFRVAVHVGRCAEPTGVCAQGAEEMADWLDMSAGEVVAHLRSLEELAVVSAYAPGAGGWCPAGIESADPDRVLVCHTPPVGADTDEADERGVQVPAVLAAVVCGEVARHFCTAQVSVAGWFDYRDYPSERLSMQQRRARREHHRGMLRQGRPPVGTAVSCCGGRRQGGDRRAGG